jgi:plasmid replication initiation protein
MAVRQMTRWISWYNINHSLPAVGIVFTAVVAMLFIAAAGMFSVYLLAEHYGAIIAWRYAK